MIAMREAESDDNDQYSVANPIGRPSSARAMSCTPSAFGSAITSREKESSASSRGATA
jgi:hypothetical protein